MDELEYQDISDNDDPMWDAEKEDDRWWDPDSGGDIRRRDLLEQAMGACPPRKYFRSRKERRQWLSIESKLEKQQMQEAWILEIVEETKKLNHPKLRRPFSKLLLTVLNMGRYQDWVGKRHGNIPTDINEYKSL